MAYVVDDRGDDGEQEAFLDPSITTAAVVSRAMANSRRRRDRIRRIPPTSMSPAAIKKTIAAWAAMGKAG